ncbi:MAG: CDP-alcohol phosphatidyltransferase family protein, partial [Nitrosopumilus sp.]
MLNNLRETLAPTLEKIGKGFASTGLSPNVWTCVGLAFALIAALVYGMGIEFGLIIGGTLLLVSG